MIKAILFDLDGTLTNTLEDIADAMNRSLRLHDLPEWPLDAYRYLVGDGAKKLAERAVRERQDLARSVQQAYQAYYETHTRVKTQPYNGVPEMLNALQAMGVKLSVFSNKPDADTKNVVAHFFSDVPWAAVRGQVEGVPVKPDPAGAIAVADAMGVTSGEVLYLGDTATDMQCAVRAGMHPVGALWGFRTKEELRASGAEFLAAEPAQVLHILHQLMKQMGKSLYIKEKMCYHILNILFTVGGNDDEEDRYARTGVVACRDADGHLCPGGYD